MFFRFGFTILVGIFPFILFSRFSTSSYPFQNELFATLNLRQCHGWNFTKKNKMGKLKREMKSRFMFALMLTPNIRKTKCSHSVSKHIEMRYWWHWPNSICYFFSSPVCKRVRSKVKGAKVRERKRESRRGMAIEQCWYALNTMECFSLSF